MYPVLIVRKSCSQMCTLLHWSLEQWYDNFHIVHQVWVDQRLSVGVFYSLFCGPNTIVRRHSNHMNKVYLFLKELVKCSVTYELRIQCASYPSRQVWLARAMFSIA